ncbi:MAG: hypothetical protein ABI488_04780, partial [Polyangiaceae bacterium]
MNRLGKIVVRAAYGALLSLVAISGFGCSGEKQADELTSSTSQALVQQTYAIKLPQGVSPSSVIFGTENSLFLSDGVDLREADNSHAQASNVGTVTTNVGVQAAPGNLFSVAPALLRDRAHVYGFVRGQSTVTTQSQVVVDGGIQRNFALGARTAASWNVTFPTPQRDVVLNPGQISTLTPGAYGVLSVASRATVTFSAPGVYYFNSFALEPQGTLSFNNANGPIYVFVQGGPFTYRGVQVRQGATKPNILFGYYGTSDAVIDAPFLGTLVAPNAKISLIATSAGHKGSFFGKSVDAANPWTRYDHQAFAPGDCSTNSTACSIGFGCADTNNNGKADCGECPAGNDLTDSDLDGVPNCIDACPADKDKSQPGICGCNHADTDGDHDGFADACQDACPNDPLNTCVSSHRPGFLPIPTWPGTSPDPTGGNVDLTTCFSEAALPPPAVPDPAHVPPPTASQLNAAFNAAPNTGGTCTPEVDVANCPLATTTATSCESTDPLTKGLADPSLCAPLGANYRCGYGKPPSCATDPNQAVCQGKSLVCGLPDPACVNDVAPQDTSPTSCTGGTSCACMNVGDPNCGCAEIRVCPAPDYTGNSGPGNPNAYTPSSKPTSTAITNNVNPPPPPVFQDPPNSIDCPRNVSGNCWCRLAMDNPGPVSDGDSKHGD